MYFSKKLLATAVAVIAVVGASVAFAAIPGAGGVITGCVGSKGALKVIDADGGATCDAGEQSLAWNQQGPAGAQGAQGPQGPAGPQGLQGERGPSDGYFTKTSALIVPGTLTTIATLGLPPGTYLVFAKVEVIQGQGIGCSLSGGGNQDGVLLGFAPGTSVWLHGTDTKPLMIPVTFSRPLAGTQNSVEVACHDDEQHRVWARISAIKVGELTQS